MVRLRLFRLTLLFLFLCILFGLFRYQGIAVHGYLSFKA